MRAADVKIRRANANDAEAILPLAAAYRVFYKQQPDPQRERAFIESQLNNPTTAIYVAELDGTAAGFMQMFKSYSTVRLASSWILEDLFVNPTHRGKGIASALLQRALEHAKEDGAAGMFLETAYDNETAQRVYERAGWTREGRFFKYNAPLG